MVAYIYVEGKRVAVVFVDPCIRAQRRVPFTGRKSRNPQGTDILPSAHDAEGD